jgi:hypothetical protein
MLPTLTLLDLTLCIHRFPPDTPLPSDLAKKSRFLSITLTPEELSIVCDSSVSLDSPRSERGWSCLKVLGPLEFSLTGILSGIASVLAKEGISIFTLSTFDTDYILIPSSRASQAVEALTRAGYPIVETTKRR